MEQQRYVAQRDGGTYLCGAPNCGSPYWIDDPTDVGCENGHLVPDWQRDALYTYCDDNGDAVRAD